MLTHAFDPCINILISLNKVYRQSPLAPCSMHMAPLAAKKTNHEFSFLFPTEEVTERAGYTAALLLHKGSKNAVIFIVYILLRSIGKL